MQKKYICSLQLLKAYLSRIYNPLYDAAWLAVLFFGRKFCEKGSVLRGNRLHFFQVPFYCHTTCFPIRGRKSPEKDRSPANFTFWLLVFYMIRNPSGWRNGFNGIHGYLVFYWAIRSWWRFAVDTETWLSLRAMHQFWNACALLIKYRLLSIASVSLNLPVCPVTFQFLKLAPLLSACQKKRSICAPIWYLRGQFVSLRINSFS